MYFRLMITNQIHTFNWKASIIMHHIRQRSVEDQVLFRLVNVNRHGMPPQM